MASVKSVNKSLVEIASVGGVIVGVVGGVLGGVQKFRAAYDAASPLVYYREFNTEEYDRIYENQYLPRSVQV